VQFAYEGRLFPCCVQKPEYVVQNRVQFQKTRYDGLMRVQYVQGKNWKELREGEDEKPNRV
jgi:hypothetical protein